MLGIILAVLAVIVLVRRPGSRGPYACFLLAACTFTLFNLLDVPRWVMRYKDDVNYETYTNMTAASSTLYWWTTAFLSAAAFFVLRNRQNAAMAVNGTQPEALGIVKLFLDLILLVAFGVLGLVRSAYLASINNDPYIGQDDYE